MNVTILGAGNVGRAIGACMRELGHRVTYGVRDPNDESALALRKTGELLEETTAAAADAEVIVLAVPWAATEGVLRSLGNLDNKVLLDVTNPIGPGFQLTHGHTDSGGEQVARWASGARVVKVFNTNGVEVMRNRQFPGGKPLMYVAGDDAPAVSMVAGWVERLGYEAICFDTLAEARILEPLTLLWIKSAMKLQSREIALHMMRR